MNNGSGRFVSWVAAVLFLLVGPAARAEPAAAPPRMESYELVILYRGKHPPTLTEPEGQRLQEAHLGHLRKMAEAGKLVVAGPLGDQVDPAMRGLCLYRVGSLDEARRLAEEDPAVKAGRLRVEVMTWYTEKGAMAFPIAEKMRSTPPEPKKSP